MWLYQKADFDALNDAPEVSLPPEAILDGGDVNRVWPYFEQHSWMLGAFYKSNPFINCAAQIINS